MIDVGIGTLEIVDLREIVDHDVGVGRVQHQKVLMILLRGVEALERLDLGDDRRVEQAGLVELIDIRLGDLGLLGVLREDGGAILRAGIRALAMP